MKSKFYSFIDEDVLKVADNFLNLIDENVLLNWKIVNACQFYFSPLELSELEKQNIRNHMYEYVCSLDGYKGKEKKRLKSKIQKLSGNIENYRM